MNNIYLLRNGSITLFKMYYESFCSSSLLRRDVDLCQISPEVTQIIISFTSIACPQCFNLFSVFIPSQRMPSISHSLMNDSSSVYIFEPWQYPGLVD